MGEHVDPAVSGGRCPECFRVGPGHKMTCSLDESPGRVEVPVFPQPTGGYALLDPRPDIDADQLRQFFREREGSWRSDVMEVFQKQTGGYAVPAALDPGMTFAEACELRPGRIGDNAGVEAVLAFDTEPELEDGWDEGTVDHWYGEGLGYP